MLAFANILGARDLQSCHNNEQNLFNHRQRVYRILQKPCNRANLYAFDYRLWGTDHIKEFVVKRTIEFNFHRTLLFPVAGILQNPVSPSGASRQVTMVAGSEHSATMMYLTLSVTRVGHRVRVEVAKVLGGKQHHPLLSHGLDKTGKKSQISTHTVNSTVEPLNKRHFGTSYFVLCLRGCPLLRG